MKRIALMGALAVVGLLPAAKATTSYVTPVGSTLGGQPVSAEADFTFTNVGFTVVIKDLLANPTDAAQLISGLSFTLSSGTSLTLSSSSAQQITISGGAGVPTAAMSTGWGFGADGGGFILCVLCQGSGVTSAAAPSQLIIGPGPYTNANGSINGNGPHNPFLNQSATFTVTGNGFTSLTSVSNVVFYFGTTDGSSVGGIPEVPEPVSLSLVGGGLVALAIARRRIRVN